MVYSYTYKLKKDDEILVSKSYINVPNCKKILFVNIMDDKNNTIFTVYKDKLNVSRSDNDIKLYFRSLFPESEKEKIKLNDDLYVKITVL